MYDLNAFRQPVNDSEHVTNKTKIACSLSLSPCYLRISYAFDDAIDTIQGVKLIELVFSGSYRTKREKKATRDQNRI